MMFSRLTRTLVTTTVSTATTYAIVNASTTFHGRTVKKSSSGLCFELNARPQKTTIARPSPIPTAAPARLAMSA